MSEFISRILFRVSSYVPIAKKGFRVCIVAPSAKGGVLFVEGLSFIFVSEPRAIALISHTSTHDMKMTSNTQYWKFEWTN